MRKKRVALLVGAMLLLVAGCGKESDNQESAKDNSETVVTQVAATPEAEPTTTEVTPEPTLTPTPEPTPTPTSTPTPEPTPTAISAENDNMEDTQGGIEVNGFSIEAECPVEAYVTRNDVKYGTVKHETYHSETTGMERGFNILLPADYSEEKKYPVVYLLHGIFGDEYSFMGDSNNHIKEITANLAADGQAKEMIVVMPNMYAAWDESQKPGFTQEAVAPYDNFINDFVNDLMPYIESHYSVLTGRENTAIAGFSMGGRETLFIGISRPDLFGYIGAIAPAPGVTPAKDWAMTHVGQMAEEDMHFPEGSELPYVFMICCGTKDGVVGKFPESYHNILTNNGVEHTWFEVPGADHDSKAIRTGWYNFVSTFFKN